MEHKSLLIGGRIPANTECPFASRCVIKTDNKCKHLGTEHTVPFSCAVARGFDIVTKYETQGFSPAERTFILHWRAGKPATQTVKGTGEDQLKALANACNNAGIGRGALAALDYWEEKR